MRVLTPRLPSDPSYFENFVLGDRLNFTIDYMNKNADYKSKIEVAVTELTEMSELWLILLPWNVANRDEGGKKNSRDWKL